MLSKVTGCGLLGCEGFIVNVECDVSNGLPQYAVVGLPDAGVKESKDRVYTAINNSGYRYPMKRITINLAPAELRKEGPAFDLPIAISLLAASHQVDPDSLSHVMIIGSLSLDGNVVGVSGVLPMVLTAREQGFQSVIVPADNKMEAGVVDGITVYPAAHLTEVVSHLNREILLKPCAISLQEIAKTQRDTEHVEDFASVHGQSQAKRALTIAAAGAHNVLMSGAPGSGKSMMAKAFPSILPDLNNEEILEITKIYSVAGILGRSDLVLKRPFRSPHHTISNQSLIGGGKIPKPGEVSLSHLGVLYLDELPEFSKSALETLRQPLEDHQVTISRVYASITYPASFMLVASMNPCPCGYAGDPTHECRCTEAEINRYTGKISGPLMDRIDIRVEVFPPKYQELVTQAKEEDSASMRAKVNAAREIQNARYAEEPGIFFNSQLTAALLNKYCKLGPRESAFMEKVYQKMNLSTRGYHRIIKLARTIADLEGAADITVVHLSEAVQYRIKA